MRLKALVLGLVAVLGSPASGWAQSTGAAGDPSAPNQGNSEALMKEAKEKFRQGRAAFDAKNYRGALTKFQTSQSLYPRPGTLYNWALCEQALGMAASAMTHFDELLPQLSEGDRRIPDVRARMAKLSLLVGRLTVIVDALGADIWVDGKKVGVSPLPSQGRVYVEPGKHVVEARKEGYSSEREELEIGEGSSRNVIFELKAQIEVGPGERASNGEGAGGNGGGGGREYPTGPEPSWRLPAVMTGVVAAVAGLGVGVGFTIASNIKSSDADEVKTSLLKNTSPKYSICGADRPPMVNDGECAQWESDLGKKAAFRGVAITGYVVGGIAAVGTVVATLLPAGKPGRPTEKGSVRIVPVITANDGGAFITGSF